MRTPSVALFVLIFAIGAANWVQYARTVRGSTMVEKNKEYVQAARVIGVSPLGIMRRHLLPNVLGPVLVLATINIATAIITEATLSFLGVGVPPTQPSLGTLIRVGNDFLFSGEWWITIFPGAALVIMVLAINLLGDWLRDALNPQAALKRSRTFSPSSNLPRRVSDAPRDAAGGPRHLLRHRRRARCSASSASPGAGKSLTGAAIIGLIDPPGRIAGGEIRLAGRRIDNLPYEAMRRIRGREIGAMFQDPLTSLNPLYTIGRQLVETIRTHLPLDAARARAHARSSCWRKSASRRPRDASTTIRTSSPAGCASASSSRWRSRRTRGSSSPTSRRPRSTCRSRRRSSSS